MADALHAPLAANKVFDEDAVDGVVGGEGFEKGVLEAGVIFIGFADGRDDVCGGEESVGGGVLWERALPSGVRGPVDFLALARLAASFRSEIIVASWG
ncbi:MAG: hypothetical protein R2729_21050 [Bryobacteraceae bacterium]